MVLLYPKGITYGIIPTKEESASFLGSRSLMLRDDKEVPLVYNY
jgi:hypothetical protein